MTLSTGLRLPIRPALSAGLVVAALTVAGWSAAADTKSYSYRVELAEPARKSQLRAGNVSWECRGKYCIAAARGGNVSVRGCRELASQVGRVVSYRSEIKRLESDQLDACNDALAEGASPKAAAAVSPTSTAAKPQPPARVTTEELTFTGVHQWNRAK